MADFPANPLEKLGYYLEFHDEFDGDMLDTKKWLPYYLPQWSSREQSAPHYRFNEQGLILQIEENQAPWCPEFDGDVKCSSIQTGVFAGALGSTIGQHRFKPNCIVREEQSTQRTYTPQYGYFETRVKALQATNNLVALWMIGFEEIPEESGEICIFEVFGNTATATKTEVRYGVHPFSDNKLVEEFYREILPINASDFHIYAIEWTPTYIDFFIDNSKRKRILQSPSYPMQFMMNIYEFPSDLTQNQNYPKQFVIDYFRAYQTSGGYKRV